jgi:hypothetical protein
MKIRRACSTLVELSVFPQQSKENKPISQDTLKITDHQVLDQVRETLKEHLSLEAEGYVCTTDDLYNVLLSIAANRGTLEAICTDWLPSAAPETIGDYLNDQLRIEELPQLEKQLNAALPAQTNPRIYRSPQDVAIDFHDRPY